MNLGKYISDLIDNQGRDKKWVAEQIRVQYRTFLYRLDNDGLLGKDLLALSKVLGIDLEELKKKYNIIRNCSTCKHKSIYLANGQVVGYECMINKSENLEDKLHFDGEEMDCELYNS